MSLICSVGFRTGRKTLTTRVSLPRVASQLQRMKLAQTKSMCRRSLLKRPSPLKRKSKSKSQVRSLRSSNPHSYKVTLSLTRIRAGKVVKWALICPTFSSLQSYSTAKHSEYLLECRPIQASTRSKRLIIRQLLQNQRKLCIKSPLGILGRAKESQV